MKKRNVGTSALDVDDALRSALKILTPFYINRYIELGKYETLSFYDIHRCLDAEPALYICPSKIVIAENIKLAKIEMKRRRHEKEGD